ncbi:phage tail family protein [Burkholderia pseudomallei MSHR2138]|nr:phage tail family protein [Burkholderia pseudomallei MSHR2138]
MTHEQAPYCTGIELIDGGWRMTRRATSLLPPNATALERRLADTNARISDIPVDIGALMDPERSRCGFCRGSRGTSASRRGRTTGPNR